MACNSTGGFYTRFKPHLLMVLSQIGYTFLYYITEASFNHGMNPNVYITYQHIVSGVVMFPFAYFLERKQTPKLTLALFLEIFILISTGGGFNSEHLFCELEIYISNFCCIDGEHYCFLDIRNSSCTQVGGS